MKLGLILLALIPGQAYCPAAESGLIKDSALVIEGFLRPRLARKSVPARDLAREIKKVSKLYGVPSMTIARVLLVESRGVASAHSDTGDFGLMQINQVHGVSKRCLTAWQCNMAFGTFLISRTKRICEYNVGKRGNIKACRRYEAKLEAL